jgi:hypothetical protein
MQKSSCCKATMVDDCGYKICSQCGILCCQIMNNSIQSSNHFCMETVARYSRYRRMVNLVNKLSGSGPEIDEKVLAAVMARKCKTPKDIFLTLRRLKLKNLPYDQISRILYLCTGEKPIVLTPREKGLLLTQFRILYDYWIVHKTERFFPYFMLIRKFLKTKIVVERFGEKRAAILHSMVRPLKCLVRQIKYTAQYCLLIDKIEDGLEANLGALFKVFVERGNGSAQETLEKWAIQSVARGARQQ